MRWIYKIPLRLWSLFCTSRVERELNDELRFHLEKLTEQNVSKGMAPKEAGYAALHELGGVAQIKEECRDMRRVNYIETFLQDLRYGLRQLRRNPGFTAVAVATLALGIAVNTTIFSAVSEVLLRKPPVEDPDHLCIVSSKNLVRAGDLMRDSAPDFESWQTQNHVFQDMAAAETGSFTITGKDEAESVEGERVTPNYFRVLGVLPVLGRPFLQSEGRAGSDHVAILSDSLWRERYASDPNAIGKPIEINGEPYTIVGVMPPGTDLTIFTPRLWTPLVFTPKDLTPAARSNHSLDLVLGRLRPGVTVKQAQADISTVARRLAQAYPETNRQWGGTVLTLQEYLIQQFGARPAFIILMVTVVFVLLIACANIAGLLLARGAARAHEMAVRAAVGAGRLRLARQMLTESLLIGIAGGTLGLLISIWGIHLLRAGFDFNIVGRQFAAGMHLDEPTLLYTIAASFLAAVLFSLAPAFRASKANPSGALTESGRGVAGSAARSRMRSVLVTIQIALALVLLAAAGVLMREILREMTENNGFNADHLVVAEIHLEGQTYRDPAAQAAFFRQVTQKVRSLPGVLSVSATTGLPLGGSSSTSFSIAGNPRQSKAKRPRADYFVVGPAYFRTMEIPLMKGRAFSEPDNANAPMVAIVNAELARRFFPRGDAIGRQIEVDAGHHARAQIVGIVGNVNDEPGQLTPRPQIYESYLQLPFPSMSIVLRSRVASSALVPTLRRAVWSIDKDQPMSSIQPMRSMINENGNRLMITLMGTFAGLALVLAAVGIYGVIAYSVTQRSHEIGIRIALGAQKKDVLGLVLRQGGLLAGIGCTFGVLLALPLPHVFAGLFNGFARQGPLVPISVAFIVALVALLATYIPARRAARVDPMVALRHE